MAADLSLPVVDETINVPGFPQPNPEIIGEELPSAPYAVIDYMWRNEIGMMEMLLSYISEFNHIEYWSDWRPIMVDILSCHEDVRRQRIASLSVPENWESSWKTKITNDDVENMESHKEIEEPGTSSLTNRVDRDGSPVNYVFFDGTARSVDAHVDAAESNAPEVHWIDDMEGEEFVDEPRGSSVQPPSDSTGISGQRDSVDVNKGEIKVEANDSIHLMATQEFSKSCFERISSSSFSESSFTRSGELQNLRWTDSRGHRFSCHYCEKAFKGRSQLLVHIRTHTGERPFPCRVCGKSFTQRANLGKHMLIHTGERPYSCSVCGRAFTQNIDLHRHMRIHSKER